ncbi:hypothetical protein Tsubulata_023743 [Turnera subulata]|uniref:ARID domain-containing protein n=1 Tax=Turnera subulata TaxID=218843 RepID=A0A9Q0JG08_9ROSI|nr:hypothetical protein Tsubulata_023743 [Turnera subulata]
MKGRETKGAPAADLLVCFPSRAHLTLMPKPICSPARPSDPGKRHQHHHHHQYQHQQHHLLKKSSTRGGASQASPLLWAKNKQMGSEISEPTSPKVTCAGQIKVRHKGRSCKSWQSVMEEIERIHNKGKHKKRSTWADSIGFKKEVMQFLTCLRSIRLDFRCFGSFPQPDITSDDEEEDEEYHDLPESHDASAPGSEGSEASRTVFSKWFMVLQENQTNGVYGEEERKEKERSFSDDQALAAPCVPPPNALLLMRCRSAPAKTWLEEKHKEEEKEEHNKYDEGEGDGNGDDSEEGRKQEEKRGKNLKTLMEEEKTNSNKENLVVMRYDTDFYKISTDIAKETWVVGGTRDPLSRSRSWKR